MTFSQEVKEELSKLNNLANKNEVQFEALGYFECNNISSNENYIKFLSEIFESKEINKIGYKIKPDFIMLKELGIEYNNIKYDAEIAGYNLNPTDKNTIEEIHPDVQVYTSSIDEKLNEVGYIVPGLGDAGDRIFGTK